MTGGGRRACGGVHVSLLVLVGLLMVLPSLLLAHVVRRGPGIPAGIGAVLCSLALLTGARPTALPLPFGLAGGNGALQLDALSAVFLLLLFLLAALAEAESLPVIAAAVTMLAGDLVLLAAAGALAVLALPPRLAGRRMDRIRVLAVAGLVGAAALLIGMAAPAGALLPDTGFSLVRDGLAHASIQFNGPCLLLFLVGLGVTPLIGLWPLSAHHRAMCDRAPAWAPVLAALLGLFLLLRLMLDLGRAVPAAGCGYALAALGLASALLAALASLREPTLHGAVARLLVVPNGFAVLGIGVCLLGRAEHLPVLAVAALHAVLLLLPVQALAGPAMLSLVAAMEAEAGASLLARMGGLVQSMPQASRLAAIAVSILVFLPPAGGFPSLGLLLQAILATAGATARARAAAPLPAPVLLAITATVGAVAVTALAGLAWLRLTAVAVLGRPRTPRGAAAQEMPLRLGQAVAGMLALPIVAGLLPGMWLRMLRAVGPGFGIGSDGDASPLLFLTAPDGVSTLSPLSLAMLLGAAVAGCLLVGRRVSVRPERRAPAWGDGAAPPPPWLPFGDPLCQPGPVTLRRMLADEAGLADWPVRPFGAARRMRRVLGTGGAGSAALLLLLRRQGAAMALALLAALLALGGWWRAA